MNFSFRKMRIAGLTLSLMLLAACSANVDVASVRGSFGDFNVVLLSTSTCGYCKKLRADLADWGVDYVDIGVPILLIGDQVVHGYAPDRSRELLAAANLIPDSSTP